VCMLFVQVLLGSAGCGGIARRDERRLLSDCATAFSMTPAPPKECDTRTHRILSSYSALASAGRETHSVMLRLRPGSRKPSLSLHEHLCRDLMLPQFPLSHERTHPCLTDKGESRDWGGRLKKDGFYSSETHFHSHPAHTQPHSDDRTPARPHARTRARMHTRHTHTNAHTHTHTHTRTHNTHIRAHTHTFCRILLRTAWVHAVCLVVLIPFSVLETSDH
jgi:hypothetical protein